MNIDDILLFFQNINTVKTANGMEFFCNSINKKGIANGIDLSKLDLFFNTVTDVFVYVLDNGLVEIEKKPIKFESKYTAGFFYTGLMCLKNAVLFDNTSMIFEYLVLLASKDETITPHELFELKLLEKIMPLIQDRGKESVRKYTGLVCQYTSHGLREKLMDTLDGYFIKLTD
ncbi:MAG: hypothetical protein LBJ35_07655 [Spirochaetaceae bacterium]|jgi:hypothetical protein|nr:hypothetical protein [Spirochaetaceae bacterium]